MLWMRSSLGGWKSRAQQKFIGLNPLGNRAWPDRTPPWSPAIFHHHPMQLRGCDRGFIDACQCLGFEPVAQFHCWRRKNLLSIRHLEGKIWQSERHNKPNGQQTKSPDTADVFHMRVLPQNSHSSRRLQSSHWKLAEPSRSNGKWVRTFRPDF